MVQVQMAQQQAEALRAAEALYAAYVTDRDLTKATLSTRDQVPGGSNPSGGSIPSGGSNPRDALPSLSCLWSGLYGWECGGVPPWSAPCP